MGLETLIEAAQYLEYRAEVEARDSKHNSTTSVICPTNGLMNHHGVNGTSQLFPQNAHAKTHQTRVPEPINGMKAAADVCMRRGDSNDASPTFEFNGNGGNNRLLKSGTNGGSPHNGTNGNFNNRNPGTREVHNKLEKNRRAHLKECFELLKSQLPSFEDKKYSNLAILRSAIRYINSLKTKETEHGHELERLGKEKIALQQKLSSLKKDLPGKWNHVDPPVVSDTEYSEQGDGSDNHSNDYNDTLELNEVKDSRFDAETELDADETENPIPLTVKAGQLDEKCSIEGKIVGHFNGLNGLSQGGPISLVSKVDSFPVTAVKVEKMPSSQGSGANYVNGITNNSTGLPPHTKTAIDVTAKIGGGQYYSSKQNVCN